MELDPGGGELTPYYYRDNFLLLCATVERQYGDLLTAQELDWLALFRGLEFTAQCLYVRLVSRVGPWFRESKLAYPELGPLATAIDLLLQQELVVAAHELAVEELGPLFTRPELEAAFAAQLSGPRAAGKSALLAAIEDLHHSPRALRKALVTVDVGRIITPQAAELVELLQLLFFGNRHQSLTEFVLTDLGITSYYPYSLDRAHRLFPNRQAVDEYLACATCSDSWYQLREAGDGDGLVDLAQEMLSAEIRFPSSAPRWHRLCNELARDLERLGELDLASQLYQRSERHPARERRARVLEAQGDWAGAACICEQILASPWGEEEAEAAGRILARARRHLGGDKQARRRDAFARINLVLPAGPEAVEIKAAQQLVQQWRSVHYVENQLMNSLFGLAFWEQIFAPLPGAFHNPYQSVPADMYEAEFRTRRQPQLKERLAQLRQGDIRRQLLDAYRQYSSFQCHWVNTRYIDADLVDATLAVVPADHLLAIWERMLFDPRENRRGFPDLIALGERAGDYCLIEVKGPGDALQDSQKRWLRFFAQHGIPATVAWVEWGND